MIKLFKKIHKNATELAAMVTREEHKGISEDDLDTLAEAIEILNNTYELLYDEVFVEIEDLK
jgi:acyl-CoA reductase-like NAD-dependent aldehyde dehydrogenase